MPAMATARRGLRSEDFIVFFTFYDIGFDGTLLERMDCMHSNTPALGKAFVIKTIKVNSLILDIAA